MKLFYRELGDQGPNIVILHGLFGSSDNWLPQAKMLSGKYRVYLPDLRNHGQSPHDDEFNYRAMAEDVKEFIRQNSIQAPVVIGHSMGGKAAMALATHYPDVPAQLVIVDITPRAYGPQHDHILKGLLSISIGKVKTRAEADEVLAAHVDEPAVRQFLLKNLQREPTGGFSWKMNLDAIARNIEAVGAAIEKEHAYDNPVLFIRGAKSNYVQDTDMNDIRRLFPSARLLTLDTGHWVQSEKPRELVDAVITFLGGDDNASAGGG